MKFSIKKKGLKISDASVPPAVSDQSAMTLRVSELVVEGQGAQPAAAFGSAVLGSHWEGDTESCATCIYVDRLSDGGRW